jgi:hypothetical protein
MTQPQEQSKPAAFFQDASGALQLTTDITSTTPLNS